MDAFAHKFDWGTVDRKTLRAASANISDAMSFALSFFGGIVLMLLSFGCSP